MFLMKVTREGRTTTYQVEERLLVFNKDINRFVASFQDREQLARHFGIAGAAVEFLPSNDRSEHADQAQPLPDL